MQAITYVDGEETTFSVVQPGYLMQWDKFARLSGLPSAVNMTKAPYQKGRSYIDVTIYERKFSLPFVILATTPEQLERRIDIVNYRFNPELGPGVLKLTGLDGEVWNIECIPYDIAMPGGNARGITYQEVLVSFVAPHPYLYSDDLSEVYMVGFEGGFSLPFSLPVSFGTVGTQTTVNNLGNVKAPVIIYLSGEVVNPIITNETTGEDLTIEETIADGDTLIIDTAFGEKSAMLLSGGEYTNLFDKVDPDSVFWSLEPGENIISYSASSEGENSQCRLTYRSRKSGR
jgi:hypothetical protein